MSYDGTKRSTCWSITINNPTQEDHDQTNNTEGHKWFKSFEGQIEQGEEGTHHIQGMLKTASVKWSVVKKAFPRAHIEPAKSVAALTKYVHKEDTKVAELEARKCATVATLNESLTRYWDDYTQCHNHVVAMTKETNEAPGLYLLDRLVNRLIIEGYYGVEYIGANPSVRATWKKYWESILYRAFQSKKGLNVEDVD